MADIRASSLQQAIRFATRWNMLGVVSECSVFKCSRLVRFGPSSRSTRTLLTCRVVKESGLVCVSYGKDNDDKIFVRKQIEAGVDAVIVDSVLAIRNELTSGGMQNGTR
jgi:glycerophosphodiester phosphodiesterase